MPKKVTLYGIPNCDTVKKARAWLDAQGVAYSFHDYKVDAPTRAMLDAWADACGWEPLLNRAGTTFRQLPDRDKTELSRARAFELMVAQPSMIKRPVLDVGGRITVGFSPSIYADLFGTAA